MSSQIFVKVMWSNFHQHRPRFVEMRGCDRHTDRQTHTHTHWRTDRGRPGSTYSVLKWLNIKTPTKIIDITIEINETTNDESISKSSLSIFYVTFQLMSHNIYWMHSTTQNSFIYFDHVINDAIFFHKPRPITLCIIPSKCMKCISAV